MTPTLSVGSRSRSNEPAACLGLVRRERTELSTLLYEMHNAVCPSPTDQSMFSLSCMSPGVRTSPRKGEVLTPADMHDSGRSPERANPTPHLGVRLETLALRFLKPRIRRQVGESAKERLDRTLRLPSHVHGMKVHRHTGARQTEHDVIAVEQFRNRRLDGETPVVAALVRQR